MRVRLDFCYYLSTLVLKIPEVVDQVHEDRHAVMHLHNDVLDEDGLLSTINFNPSVLDV